MKMEKFQGIVGMDWLTLNQAHIDYEKGHISFHALNGEKIEIRGRSGKNPLRVVNSRKLVKGLRKGLPINILKMNKSKMQP